MIIKDIEFTLKDGRKALLRSPKEEDIRWITCTSPRERQSSSSAIRRSAESIPTRGRKSCLKSSMLQTATP